MTRVPVTSSNIRSVGYDAGTLEVEFSTNQVYRYAGVPADVYQAMLSAPSIGAHFQEHIRKRGFACEKVTATPDGGNLAAGLPANPLTTRGVA